MGTYVYMHKAYIYTYVHVYTLQYNRRVMLEEMDGIVEGALLGAVFVVSHFSSQQLNHGVW